MQVLFLRIGLVLALLGVPNIASAADLLMAPQAPGGMCIHLAPSLLLSLPPAEIGREVGRRFGDAVETAERLDVVYNSRPAFNWAYETKYYCGKAIGYLGTSTVDAESVSKCDCFHGRMVHFLR